MALRGLVMVWLGIAILCQSAQARADAAEVEALIAKGNELRRAGTPGPALPYFQKAYELARTPRTVGQLGLAELAAGYPVEAAEHLAAALQSPNDPSIVKYKQMLADALKLARSQVGDLAVDGSPAGAEVVVDGHAVGVLPLASPLKLAARNAEVIVRAPGYAPHKEVVAIAGGQRHQLTVTLEKIEKPVAAAPVITPAAAAPPAATAAAAAAASAPVLVDEHATGDDDASRPKLRTAAWICGGAALVAAGAGLGLNLTARSHINDDDDTTFQSYRRWSLVGYVSGGALAVTSGILFWASRPPTTAPNAQARLTCTPTLNGLACRGAF
ncbi:MAG TPA: PEGA domain-containing protein [Polyangia bacterium]